MIPDEFNFELDDSLIARYPSENRDESRLMVVDRKKESIYIEPVFKNILNYINPNDILVFNETRVSKRRVYLYSKNGREHEAVFLEELEDKNWLVLLRQARKLKEGEILVLKSGNIQFEFIGREDDKVIIKPLFYLNESFFESSGNIPIPPYLKRRAEKKDEERYQTVYANQSGSVAAPTAGLHFTSELLDKLKSRGVEIAKLNLKIGYGTFAPLKEENYKEKKLHKEEYYISESESKKIQECRKSGRVFAVGTTSLRALESAYQPDSGIYKSGDASTEIFITEKDKIDSIDALVTNFHLPASSLLLLVSAFAGKELILRAYKKAINEKMRFFSYGDAMLIL